MMLRFACVTADHYHGRDPEALLARPAMREPVRRPAIGFVLQAVLSCLLDKPALELVEPKCSA